jgi:hypothetical protein
LIERLDFLLNFSTSDSAIFLYVLFMGFSARQGYLKNVPTEEQIADAEREVLAKVNSRLQ